MSRASRILIACSAYVGILATLLVSIGAAVPNIRHAFITIFSVAVQRAIASMGTSLLALTVLVGSFLLLVGRTWRTRGRAGIRDAFAGDLGISSLYAITTWLLIVGYHAMTLIATTQAPRAIKGPDRFPADRDAAVHHIQTLNDDTWLFTTTGPYRVHENAIQHIDVPTDASKISRALRYNDQVWLFGPQTSVYRVHGDAAVRVPVDDADRLNRAQAFVIDAIVYRDDLYLLTSRGVYTIGNAPQRVSDFVSFRGQFLILARRLLVQDDDRRLRNLDGTFIVAEGVSATYDLDAYAYVDAFSDAYQITTTSALPIRPDGHPVLMMTRMGEDFIFTTAEGNYRAHERTYTRLTTIPARLVTKSGSFQLTPAGELLRVTSTGTTMIATGLDVLHYSYPADQGYGDPTGAPVISTTGDDYLLYNGGAINLRTQQRFELPDTNARQKFRTAAVANGPNLIITSASTVTIITPTTQYRQSVAPHRILTARVLDGNAWVITKDILYRCDEHVRPVVSLPDITDVVSSAGRTWVLTKHAAFRLPQH